MRPGRALAARGILQRPVGEVQVAALERRRLVRVAKSRVRLDFLKSRVGLDFSPLAHRIWVVPENSNPTLLWRTLRRLRAERLADFRASFDVRTADEVETIGHCGEHAVERLLDRLGLTRKIEDQRATADDAELSREDCRGHVLEAHLAHLLAESRQNLVGDGERCL